LGEQGLGMGGGGDGTEFYESDDSFLGYIDKGMEDERYECMEGGFFAELD